MTELIVFIEVWIEPKTSLKKHFGIFPFNFFHILFPIDLLMRGWLQVLLILASIMIERFFFDELTFNFLK